MRKAENLLNIMGESILDPVHKELSTDLWTADKKLKPEAKKSIMDFIDTFVKDNDIKTTRKILTGSICTYQYAPDADVDINVSVKVSDKKINDLTSKLADYNGKLFPGTNHPMNIFLFNKEWVPGLRGASYDLETEEWEVEPKKESGNIQYKAVLELALSWTRKIDLDIGELQRDLKEREVFKYHLSIIDKLEGIDKEEIDAYIKVKEIEVRADIDVLKMDLHVIKMFRRRVFEDPNEKDIKWLTNITGPNVNYTINNVVYKLLEKFGYFDKLHEILNEYEGKV